MYKALHLFFSFVWKCSSVSQNIRRRTASSRVTYSGSIVNNLGAVFSIVLNTTFSLMRSAFKCELNCHPFSCWESFKSNCPYLSIRSSLLLCLFSWFLPFLGQILAHSHHVLMAHFSASETLLQTVSWVLYKDSLL